MSEVEWPVMSEVEWPVMSEVEWPPNRRSSAEVFRLPPVACSRPQAVPLPSFHIRQIVMKHLQSNGLVDLKILM